MLKFFCIVFCCLGVSLAYADNGANTANDFSIDLQETDLTEALNLLAKSMHANIIINHSISEAISLHVHHVSAQKVYQLLIETHNLVSIPLGNAWYVTQRNAWLQKQEDSLKVNRVLERMTPLETKIWQIHFAKAQDIMHILKNNTSSLLSRRGKVHIDVRTNIICIQDTKKRLEQIAYLIERLDIPVQQILIEARLASVDSDFERELGIHYSTLNSTLKGETSYSPKRYGILIAKLADGSLLDMQLTALENKGHAELISSPRLFTANQQTAAIESGDEIPYQQESPSGGTVVVFKKAVIGLKVTPQILPGNKVLLQLHINQDKPSKLLIRGVPAISTRQITTSILVKNGQTVVLGGIYEVNREHAKQLIPFIGKIPLLGLLFQENATINNKRELLIFVTPKIIPE